jgi:hypothetical protein
MEGMLSGNQSEQITDPGLAGRFNGVVQSDEGPIEVKNGIAVVGRMAYFVSDDGSLVGDKDGQLVAVILDGKVIEPTQEIIDQLRAEGKIEGEQPQGMAGQAPQ